jgi:outer membrane putative beta-barrel porin/alpha-amylase
VRYGQTAATLLVLIAALFAFAGSAQAQSCGGSAGPSLGAGAAAEGPWLKKGEGTARLSTEYEVRDTSYEGGDKVENTFDESVFITRVALEIRYGLTDDWTASITPTYPHYTYRLKPPGGERITQTFRGPGDTLVALGRRLMGSPEPPAEACDAGAPAPEAPMLFHEAPARRWSIALWGGVSIPTGTPEEPNPAVVTSDVTVANLQTGTGTFDPLLRARFDWEPAATWSAFAEASVLYPLYENRFDYRTADSESVVVGASVPLVRQLSASLSLMWQRVGTDQFQGEDVGVGGAQWIYVIPGLGWEISDRLFLDVSVRLPLWRHTETKLSDSNAIYQAGLTFYF